MIAESCTTLWIAWAGMFVAWAIAMIALWSVRRTLRKP